MSRFTCRECDYSKTVPDEYAGKKVKCPKCEAANRIPESDSSNAGSSNTGLENVSGNKSEKRDNKLISQTSSILKFIVSDEENIETPLGTFNKDFVLGSLTVIVGTLLTIMVLENEGFIAKSLTVLGFIILLSGFLLLGRAIFRKQHWIEQREKQRVLEIERMLEELRLAYRGSLERLKSSPGDPDLRQATLKRGRAYAAACREDNVTTIFDEAALSNDIAAVCASAGEAVSRKMGSEPRSRNQDDSLESRLEKLAKLRSSELISEAEYQEKRSKILDSI